MSYPGKDLVLFKEYFQKSKSVRLYVRLLEEKGKPVIDIREWIETKGYTGWTKKGIRLGLISFIKVQRVMGKLYDMLEETGHIEEAETENDRKLGILSEEN